MPNISVAEKQAIRPIRMKAISGRGVSVIIAGVPSRSQPGLEHVVYLDVATGRALHGLHGCRCGAAAHGRPCWHTKAVVEAAREHGYLPTATASVWDTPAKRDRDEEI